MGSGEGVSYYFKINFDNFAVEIVTASSSIFKCCGLCITNYDVSLTHLVFINVVYDEINTQKMLIKFCKRYFSTTFTNNPHLK